MVVPDVIKNLEETEVASENDGVSASLLAFSKNWEKKANVKKWSTKNFYLKSKEYTQALDIRPREGSRPPEQTT